MGGIAIFLAMATGLLITVVTLVYQANQGQVAWLDGGSLWTILWRSWGFLLGSVLVFALGVYDDIRRLSPPAKLIGQIVAAGLVISFGYTTNFFTPRLANNLVAQLPNIVLTFIWLVGITNAINLLDNMDGLAGGISLITAVFLGYLFWRAGNVGLVLVCAALAGSLVGFLYFNLPPAKIFMGDSGSLFLGFTLACLAIARQPQASNVFAVLAVPTLLFLLPILDTALVTFTRLMRGESPMQGGRDHTSHRLIAFGLNERQALWFLYGMAILSGILAAAVESIGYRLSLILVPIVIISLALVTAYLAGIKVSASPLDGNSTTSSPAKTISNRAAWNNPLLRVVLDFTIRRRLLEVVLDFIVIILAFYLAYLVRYGLFLSEVHLSLFLQALPVLVVITYLAFFANGVYRGVWRFVGTDDYLRYLKAVMTAGVLSAAGVYLLYSIRTETDSLALTDAYPSAIFLLYAIFLFLGVAATRSSFKVLDRFGGMQVHRSGQRVLIFGAGNAGEMALRWILMNPGFNYQPVGFIADDPLLTGRFIHGVQVIGDIIQYEEILRNRRVDGVILANEIMASGKAVEAIKLANQYGCWVRRFNLDFELME
jgi:UDP-GlcNAc:undecaprenyl-phosphate GlcNAc-1-phosphate transferase